MPKPLKLIYWGLIAVLVAFGVWLSVVFSHYTVPILMYHYVNDEEPSRSRLGVSPATFERQMRFLSEHKYNVIPLEELADLIINKRKIPPKTAAITFDDGYLDNYTRAYPILKKYNLPATIFVVINRLGNKMGNDEYMSWVQVRELSDSGLVTIASHSMNHPNLSEIESEQEMEYEIYESKKILEERLGRQVKLFSYPFGGINHLARSIVSSSGYKSAVGTNFPKGYPNNDIYALKRLRISETSRNMFVFRIVISGHYTFIKENRDDD